VNLGLLVIQDDELVMALERGVLAGRGFVAEPPGGGRTGAAGQRGLERRERAADMVEHPVQDDAQTTLARPGDQPAEVVLIAKAGIDLEVADGVVAMGLGGEDRAEQQARTPELDRIVQPALQLPQPVPDGLLLRQLRLLRTGEAERVHVPPDSVIGP
jgi:hypothetical protein